ncbi:integrase [Halogeometricum borinquense]|uniref:Integrase n=1 Tax=Halogeometricum borinquense TaxID=60847 RepID=A0A482T830_9EURY|nr:integrase [Halogeometricum borinquense]
MTSQCRVWSLSTETRELADDIRPYNVMGGRGSPDDVTPHSLRHSVVYRMMTYEDKHIYDMKKRLRHVPLQTTDQIYSHFDRV